MGPTIEILPERPEVAAALRRICKRVRDAGGRAFAVGHLEDQAGRIREGQGRNELGLAARIPEAEFDSTGSDLLHRDRIPRGPQRISRPDDLVLRSPAPIAPARS